MSKALEPMLGAELAKLGISDETYTNYASTVLADSSLPEEEVRKGGLRSWLWRALTS